MTNRSGSSVRGIRYAIAIGLIVTILFCVGEYVSAWKRPGYYRAPRTTTLMVRAQPGKVIKIVAEPLPIIPQAPVELMDRSMWASYKSEAPMQLDTIEPPAGARLAAPVALDFSDPFAEGSALLAGSPEATELRETIDASTVSASKPVTVRISGGARPAELWERSWPRPVALEINVRQAHESTLATAEREVNDWLASVEQVLSDLQSKEIGSSAGQSSLEAMEVLVADGHDLTQKYASDIVSTREISRIAHALDRRHAVWAAVQLCVAKSKDYVAPRKYSINSSLMAERLEVAKRAIALTEDSSGWSSYLVLDRIEDLSKGRISSKEEQVAIARQFLRRVTNTRVTPDQLQVLRSSAIHRLADQVHPLTIKPVDYRKLLMDLETIESTPIHRCAADIADAVQSLRFSEHPEIGAVASAINTHYRNANVRLSVSEAFLNRMMPRGLVSTQPVQQRILGADTRGASRVRTDLAVDIVPDMEAWKLRIKLDGDVDSITQSSRNGATFFNSSSANVQTSRELRIDGQSLTINGTPARVESSDSLRRFSTDWDSLPIVGDMIRYVAHREFTQSRPIAKRITQRLIAKQTDEQFDRQLKTQIHSAQDKFESRLLGPLQTLQLSPLVMDMQSTDDRLIARYRLADENHLSSYTPRPLAPGDSQLSLQIHQSIFNNLADRAIDTNRDWSIQQLSDSLADILQQPRPVLPNDTPNDVIIRFAAPNPVSIEFEDGKMCLILRIASLEQPGRMQLKNFLISSSYKTIIDGLQAELVRDGVISVDGHRIGARERVPLRGIFTKVFSTRTNIPMVAQSLLEDPRAQGLVVSQLEMRDGWLAIAVSERSGSNTGVASEPKLAAPVAKQTQAKSVR